MPPTSSAVGPLAACWAGGAGVATGGGGGAVARGCSTSAAGVVCVTVAERGSAVCFLPEPVWVCVLLSTIFAFLAGGAIFVAAALLRDCVTAFPGGAVDGLGIAAALAASGDTGSPGRVEAVLVSLS